MTATRAAEGVYCIEIAGISPSTAVMIASVEYSLSSTFQGGAATGFNKGFVEVRVGAAVCSSSTQFEVRGFELRNDTDTISLVAGDQGFTFLVP